MSEPPPKLTGLALAAATLFTPIAVLAAYALINQDTEATATNPPAPSCKP